MLRLHSHMLEFPLMKVLLESLRFRAQWLVLAIYGDR
jgi:hypothetical protein